MNSPAFNNSPPEGECAKCKHLAGGGSTTALGAASHAAGPASALGPPTSDPAGASALGSLTPPQGGSYPNGASGYATSGFFSASAIGADGSAALQRQITPASNAGEDSYTAAASAPSAAGLSLVELLIALAISSILALGVMELLGGTQESGRLLRAQAALGEAGRLAMALVTRDLQQAGYRGCNSLTAADAAAQVQGIPYEFDLLRGLQGYEGGAGSWAPDFASAGLPTRDGGRNERVYAGARTRSGVNLRALREGSDFFTVWFVGGADFPLADPARTLADGDEDLLLAAEEAEVEDAIRRDQIAFLSDCVREALFMVTGLTERGGQAVLGHDALRRVGGTGNAAASFGPGFAAGAAVSPIVSRTYYVGQSANDNNLGAPVFSLYLKEGGERPVELAEGVEDMQLLYGVAADAVDAAPSLWAQADAVADWSLVRSVHVEITATSVDGLPQLGGDGLLRRTLTQTVALRNRQ